MTIQQVTTILTIQPKLVSLGVAYLWRICDATRPVAMAGANSVAIDGEVMSVQNLGIIGLICMLQGSNDRSQWRDSARVARFTAVGPYGYQAVDVIGFDFVRLWYHFDSSKFDPATLTSIVSQNPSCQLTATIRTLQR